MTKRCHHCKLEKAIAEFYRNRSRVDGLSQQCKACDKMMVKRYQSTDNGKRTRSERVRVYRSQPHVQEALKEYEATRRDAKNRQHAEYKRSERGRSVYNQIHRRRRDLLQGLDFALTLEDIAQIHDRFDHCCFNCRSTVRLEIDHHRPLSLGFGLSMSNAVLLCKKCNTSKNKKLPEVFYTPQQLESLRGHGII